MKYQKINEGGVSREDGISFQIKHPDYIEYYEQDNVAIVTMDYDPTTRAITVYASNVNKWKTSSGITEMPQDKKQQLINTLEEGLVLLKGKFVVK